jgi:hypothetical protein
LLGNAGNVRVSASRDGPFEPLRNVAEFRDLVVSVPARSNAEAAAAPVVAPSPPTFPSDADDQGAPVWLTTICVGALVLTGFLAGLFLLTR